MKKIAGIMALPIMAAILLFAALSSCSGLFIDPGMADMGGGGSGGSGNSYTNWWTWNSTLDDDSNYDSTSHVSISKKSATGCDVSVTGDPNPNHHNWASQVSRDYTATVERSYKVTWKWAAKDKPFGNVSIRYAQQKDYQNDAAYQLGTNIVTLIIPVSGETKEYEFTMPDNCNMSFAFFVGGDIGSFTIRDFKIEEKR